MKLLKNNFILLGLFVFLLSCEPDDICLTSIDDTPRLIIGFYDKTNGELGPNFGSINLRISMTP